MAIRGVLSRCGSLIYRIVKVRSLQLFVGTLGALGAVFGLLIWITSPTAQINAVVLVLLTLIASTLTAHWLAEHADSSNPGWVQFWTIVDYPWVLAAFGTLLISTAKYDLDLAKQSVLSAENSLSQIGTRLDQRCSDTLTIIAQEGRGAGQIAQQSLRNCFSLKVPGLEHTADFKEVDKVFKNLDQDELRANSAARIAALLVVPSYLQPLEPDSLALKDSFCRELLQKERVPNPLILSGIAEAFAKVITEDFAGRLYTPPTAGHTYWRPSPYILAVEQGFETDEILFCGNIQILEHARSQLQRKKTLWGFVDLLTAHLPVWYLTLAVFAGLRLGKTAFETRPKDTTVR
jgi:hypothetical protein